MRRSLRKDGAQNANTQTSRECYYYIVRRFIKLGIRTVRGRFFCTTGKIICVRILVLVRLRYYYYCSCCCCVLVATRGTARTHGHTQTDTLTHIQIHARHKLRTAGKVLFYNPQTRKNESLSRSSEW